MKKSFNTAGPCKPDIHYVLPPLARLNLAELEALIAAQKYFVLHAPRQTGKTTCLLALQDHLNRQGELRALYFNVEVGQSAREDVARAMHTVLAQLGQQAEQVLKDSFVREHSRRTLEEAGPDGALNATLARWAEQSPKPLVMLIDEIDALVGDSLISVLRQLRTGYTNRPASFPQSVLLCGVRDVRDYRIHSSQHKEIITGGSAFNIKAESLRLGDFCPREIAELYGQHTQATGQVFTEEAQAEAWRLTRGQPWLVNALAYEACFRMSEGKDRARPITGEVFRQAAENLILRRDTHLDQLVDKLREERVRRVIAPMLAGEQLRQVPEDDVRYLVDLGLLRLGPKGEVEIANAIYKEILPRVLNFTTQVSMPTLQPTWLKPDGRLDLDKLLDSFVAFWRQHGEPLLGTTDYHEVAPHLVLMAFLQRITNGEGAIEREYAVGRGRMDLCLRYAGETLPLELKVWRDGRPDPLTEGLDQLDGYLASLALSTGWLVLFDQRSGQPPLAERTRAERAITPAGRTVTVIRA
ncbi:MAG: ATP-binding protein [Verrucomicrobia bacterium]|nr:ATP-binding protein [Verrucomicrobiota bacterium]